jgi:hypothetical protein
MPSRSPQKKPKAPLPKLNLEEMEHDPSMKGMLSFLEDSPAERLALIQKRAEIDRAMGVVPFPAAPEAIEKQRYIESPTGGVSKIPPVGDSETHTVGIILAPDAPVETPPVGTLEAPPVPGSTATVTKRVPLSEVPPVGVSETPTDLVLTPPPVISDVRHVKLRPVRSIQDGLTPGEFLLLTEMFKAATPLAGTKDRQLNAGGYRTLSDRTRQDPKTVKRNRQGLLRKFCVEEIRANTFIEATQFRVLHFETILIGWRKRGLNWVCRAGRSVELSTGQGGGIFDSPTGAVLDLPTGGVSERPTGGVSEPPSVGTSEIPTGETPTGGGGETPTGPVGVSPTLLSYTSTLQESSSKQWPIATRTLAEAMGYGDDDAVERMAEAALHNAPDATDEELAHFIRDEAPRVIRNRNIDNPMGMLIRQVPRRFVGESFQIYREAKRLERAARDAENLKCARQILSEPQIADEDRQWAETIVREHDQS